MKLRTVVLFMLAVVIAAGCSKGYRSERTVDDLKVTLSAGSYPLIKGDNTLAVLVADATGAAVTGATVNVRYFMPPMPGMAPMDFKTQAVEKGAGFAFTANIPMEGGWKVEVAVARPGKPTSMATFNLDAR
jgi:hypothetical protein